jgi:aryl-alcohol dehydrogenase-like predicted oxidoreductase
MPDDLRPAAAAGRITVGDLVVNRLGFGAMRVAGRDIWGEPPDRKAARDVLRRACELGHEFFDTADSYGPHVSESLLAEALHPYPPGIVLATKGGLLRPSPKEWVPCGRPDHLRTALEGILRRLRVERIDLYQLHSPDPNVPFADSVGALAELRRAGKIRHVGVSNVTREQLDEARAIVPIVSVQNRYNVEDRSHEDVLLACEQAGIAFIPWYPLGAGKSLTESSVQRVAARLSATPSQVALAWLLARSPAMLPIPGTRSVRHAEENAGAAGLRLLQDDLAALDAV